MAMNKQYGLILNKKNNAVVSKSNIFNLSDSNDSDEGDSDWVKKSLQKSSENSHVKRETKVAMQKALEEDSTVYQYDEIYDQMEQKKTDIQKNKEKDRKPKYIEKLLQTSEKRKRENERRIERQVQKEREAEGEQFKDKESFVTSAYKKKLEEFAKLDEEERRMDMLEEIGDVTKQEDISGFYRHLYQSTVVKNEDSKVSDKKETSTGPENKSKPFENKSKPSDVKLKSDHKSKPSDKHLKIKNELGKRSGSKTENKKKNNDSRNYRKRKQSESSEGKKGADSSSDSSSSSSSSCSSSSSDSSSESEKDIPLDKETKEKKKSKSPPPKKSKTDNEPSIKADINDSKVAKKAESVSSKNHQEQAKIELKSPKKSTPDISIWQKRTVGPLFDAALKRYYERKAARDISKRKG